MKISLCTLLLLLPLYSNADCWVAKNMKGTSYSQSEDYKRIDDGFSGTFMITIAEKNSSVVTNGIDADGISYLQISPNTLMGFSQSKTGAVVETWAINDSKVLMTKVMTGWGEFNSAKSFVGDVVGKC